MKLIDMMNTEANAIDLERKTEARRQQLFEDDLAYSMYESDARQLLQELVRLLTSNTISKDDRDDELDRIRREIDRKADLVMQLEDLDNRE